MAKPVIEVLLNVLEDMASGQLSRVTIIFTTTTEGNDLFEEQLDANPFTSRVISISLARRDIAQPFAERCHEIAESEGLNGKPIEEYIKLARKTGNNFRAMLQAIEMGEMLEGHEVSNEMYVCRLNAGDLDKSIKMMLLR